MNDPRSSEPNSLTAVIDLIRRELRAGAKHGFFELGVEVGVVNGDRREFTIRAGKSWRIVLRSDELDR